VVVIVEDVVVVVEDVVVVVEPATPTTNTTLDLSTLD
jgi:hypothetical protein